MVLRVAKDEELADVVALVNVAYRGSEGWAVEFRVVAGPRTTAELLRAEIAAKPEAMQLVWRDDVTDELMGTVWVEPMQGGVWYLGLLCVRPDAQQKQHGRTLLTAAEDVVRERGARRVRITVMTVRDTLLAWYERRGYVKTGEVKPFPYGDESVGRPMRDGLEFAVLEKAL